MTNLTDGAGVMLKFKECRTAYACRLRKAQRPDSTTPLEPADFVQRRFQLHRRVAA